MEGVFGELAILGLPRNLDLLLRAEDEPAFLHAGAGVGAQFRAIIIMAGHGYLDDQFGGVGMLTPKILFRSANDRNVRFWFGVFACDGLLAIKEITGRKSSFKQSFQPPQQ